MQVEKPHARRELIQALDLRTAVMELRPRSRLILLLFLARPFWRDEAAAAVFAEGDAGFVQLDSVPELAGHLLVGLV